jgi:lysophospholipase L1-like esterase
MKLPQLGLLTMAIICTVISHAGAASGFFLKNGDHVCFYGDSITEQRYYAVDVETYVRTRFPNLNVRFVDSGVGGDRVTGGWAGPIDLRLKRDVFAFKPNVVTIMLGMNDAGYRPFNEHLFNIYRKGYEHIISMLQKHLPGVRIVLIEPSAYDDVTQKPHYPGGYNAVLIRYGQFVKRLAARNNLLCVNFNAPMVSVLRKAEAENPRLAARIIPGRIHPSAAGHLVLAKALLRAWGAPATVTALNINAGTDRVITSVNTTVRQLSMTGGVVSWTQTDSCLPCPIMDLHNHWPQFAPTCHQWEGMSFPWMAPKVNWNYTNPLAQLILHVSGWYKQLDDQRLRVTGLPDARYRLVINEQNVGIFPRRALAAGINLARYKTPMMRQAYHVLALVWKQVQWRFFAWRGIQTQLSFNHNAALHSAENAFLRELELRKQAIIRRQYQVARPLATHYQLVPISD